MTPNAKNLPVGEHPQEEQQQQFSATHLKLPAEIGTDYSFRREVVWWNAIGFLMLHLSGLYGCYRVAFSHIYTFIWMGFLALASGEGVTIGAHRLYSHKAFKATPPLRVVLLILHTIAGQNCLYIWVRDHRQHHKYSDTDADPHNANRGFFFSHVGWLMSRKHPAVLSKGKTIDMSDLEADWMVMFQKQFYKPLYTIFALALPVGIPVYYWNETYWNSLFVAFFARYVIMLNITWLVNSAAHFYGTKPYDKNLKPVESALVSFLSQGEGWHNYHHAFPWDYRAAELGSRYSMTTFIINMLAAFGLAYDLRTTPAKIVEHRVLRTGDGSHPIHECTFPSYLQSKHNHNNNNNNNNNDGDEGKLIDKETGITQDAAEGSKDDDGEEVLQEIGADGLVKRAASAVQG